MSRFWGNIICLFCICFFSFAIANDVNLLSCFHFSDKKYAKNIEIYAYLITKDQVVKLFDEENGEVIQKTNKELYGQEVFLLVRCKNLGDSKSFGTLVGSRAGARLYRVSSSLLVKRNRRISRITLSY